MLDPTRPTIAHRRVPRAGWVLGQDIAILSDRAKTRFRCRNIGFVFQQFNLIPTLTAAENVAIPLIAHGAWQRAALAQA